MIRKFSKRSLVVLISILFTGGGLIWACAWDDWDEYGVSAFAPEAFVAGDYSPFFYSDQFYYGIGYDNEQVSRFNEDIVRDWAAYLDVPVTDTGLRYLLLTISTNGIDSLAGNKGMALPGVAADDPVWRNTKKTKAFLMFLTLAKANESFAAVRHDYWSYEEDEAAAPFPEAGRRNLQLMQDQFKTAADPFLKQRYWFQILRSRFFAGDYDQCIAFYDRHKAVFPANNLSYRAMSYAAGAYYKQKKYAAANYLYSRVYDAGPQFRTVAHYSFHPQEEADWQKTLALCNNKEEKITLWQLLGIYYDEQRSIQEIYALDPHSEKLDLLLSRLINIEENRVSGYQDHFYTELRSSRDSLSKGTLDLVTRIADAGNTDKPWIWHQAAGYLHFLYEEYKAAGISFDRAAQAMPQDSLPAAQLRLLVFINRLGAAAKIDAATEQLLLPDLQWLEDLQTEKQSMAGLRYRSAYTWAKATLSRRYAAQREWIRSECFGPRDTFYTIPARVTAMKSFLLKTGISPFEQYCRRIYYLNAADINEYQAVQLAYQDRIADAIPLMTAGSGDSVVLAGNPFNGRIRDCHDCDHEAPQKIKYTKLDLLHKLQEMKDLAAAGKDAFTNYMLIANAYYNMTYYGNARYFYECKVISPDYSSSIFLSKSFKDMLTDCSLPVNYYRKALAAAQNDEQKARCTFMIAKCMQNQMYNREAAAGNLESYGYSYFGPVDFKDMKAYSRTKYYQEVISECGYFRTYLGM